MEHHVSDVFSTRTFCQKQCRERRSRNEFVRTKTPKREIWNVENVDNRRFRHPELCFSTFYLHLWYKEICFSSFDYRDFMMNTKTTFLWDHAEKSIEKNNIFLPIPRTRLRRLKFDVVYLLEKINFQHFILNVTWNVWW